ncbi:MAG: hypothetical protein QM658_14230 [Gordonia sp. (in: high G+C Gram-positive bacteria)]
MIDAEQFAKAIALAAENGLDPMQIDEALEVLRARVDAAQDRLVARDRLMGRLARIARQQAVQVAQYGFRFAPRNAVGRAVSDVAQLVEDVREIDPVEVWVRLSSWQTARLCAALIAACAALDPDESLHARWAWTRDLAA